MKERLKWFSHWLLKSLFFIASLITFISGISYFIKGGILIKEGQIPLFGILFACAIPAGLITIILMFYLITETEKELEDD